MTLYTGDAVPNQYVTVPDLSQMKASTANQTIINAGLNPVSYTHLE